MVKSLNKKILAKVDEIILEIENSSSYEKYLILQKQMETNQELMSLINEVKQLQKQCVKGDLSKEKVLKEKLIILDDNPLYREYNNTLNDINNSYAIVEQTLNNYFESKMN